MKKKDFQHLSRDEMGKLQGGFTISPIMVVTFLENKNGNCDNGGTKDTNQNCKCNCGSNLETTPPKDKP